MQVEGRSPGAKVSERSGVTPGAIPSTTQGPQAQGLLEGTPWQGATLHAFTGIHSHTRGAWTRFPTAQTHLPHSVREVRVGPQREGGGNRGERLPPGTPSDHGGPHLGPAWMATPIPRARGGWRLPATVPPPLLPLSQTQGLPKGQDSPGTQSIDRSNSREGKTRAGEKCT